jgi:DNA-binding MarR family transcriptional regulator
VSDVVDKARGRVAAAVEPRISYVVARLERAVRAGINERVRPYELTTLQYTTLSVLGSRGQPLSNAQLARRAYMTPQSMIEVIEALERKGLIRRDPHPNHRRVYPAMLTPKGQRVLAA